MNDKFNLKRFMTFYRYDLARIWRHNGKTLLLLGFAPVIVFLLWTTSAVTISLSLEVSAPAGWLRLNAFPVVLLILELYLTKIYGFTTDKRKGADFLMLPASTMEKFISLMLNILIVIPISFIILYGLTDALLCLAFPSSGQPLITFSQKLAAEIVNYNSVIFNNQPPSIYSLYFLITMGMFCKFLFFTLCSMVFRRYKILWAILINAGLTNILALIMLGIKTPPIVLYYIIFAMVLLGTVILAALIYRRFKKISL